jgi:hypothetical protein
MDDIVIDGLIWTPRIDKPCARCGTRTFKMERRTDRELIIEALPGPTGAHVFTSLGQKHVRFNLCTQCFEGKFEGDRQRALAWERGVVCPRPRA